MQTQRSGKGSEVAKEEPGKKPAPFDVVQAIVRDDKGWSLVELEIPHDFPRKKLHGPDWKRTCVLRLLQELKR